MGYFDEMKKAATDGESVVGEAFTYNGLAGFKGFVSDEDPELTFMVTGKKTKRALVIDATKAQFKKRAVTPESGKKVIYDGAEFIVRQVFGISGDQWRFKVYMP